MTDEASVLNPGIIEVCVDSMATAKMALAAGADRLEVNSALELDGLTPSPGLIVRLQEIGLDRVIAMARPRGGNFVYDHDEWGTLLADADWLVQQGVAGIAFGCLTTDGHIDANRCRQIRAIAGSVELVFHKAFDEVANWEESLEVLIDTGIDRILTSGQSPTAVAGISRLAELHQRAQGRLEILPGGGIRSANVLEIVSGTGLRQVHGSFQASGESTPSDVYCEVEATRALLHDHLGNKG